MHPYADAPMAIVGWDERSREQCWRGRTAGPARDGAGSQAAGAGAWDVRQGGAGDGGPAALSASEHCRAGRGPAGAADRDRVALASKGDAEDADALAGVVIWASVSEEVDAKIREQIKAGVFPIRLAAADWTSGGTHWLLDVIAPTPALATSVLANMKQVMKGGDLRIHPVVTRLVEANALKGLQQVKT